MKLFSPGAVLPTVSHYFTAAALLFGEGSRYDAENMKQGSGDIYRAQSGASPSSLVYFLVAMQNMAGTTPLDLQAEFTYEHYCEFFEMKVSVLPQTITTLTEDVQPYKPTEEKKASKVESKEETKEEYELVKIPKRVASSLK